MLGGISYTFVSDRSNNPSSAVSLPSAYLQAPTGYYFTGGSLTVMAWVYPRAFVDFSPIIDFGNGGTSDDVFCAISGTGGTSGKPSFYHLIATGNSIYFSSSQPLQLNQWTHVSFTFSSPSGIANIYVNAVLSNTATDSIYRPNNVVRSLNFVGKNSFGNTNIDAIIDELKIFNVDLTQTQIQAEMTNEYYCKCFFNILQIQEINFI